MKLVNGVYQWYLYCNGHIRVECFLSLMFVNVTASERIDFVLFCNHSISSHVTFCPLLRQVWQWLLQLYKYIPHLFFISLLSHVSLNNASRVCMVTWLCVQYSWCFLVICTVCSIMYVLDGSPSVAHCEHTGNESALKSIISLNGGNSANWALLASIGKIVVLIVPSRWQGRLARLRWKAGWSATRFSCRLFH